MKIAKQSVELLDWCGEDINVVNAARVSFAKESQYEYDAGTGAWPGMPENVRLSKKDTKLINYLAEHKHKSPFNHVFMSFRVKAPIFVARQLVKHEYLPWNEVSRRYVTEEPEFYIPEVFRAKADNVKQGSSEQAIPFLTNPVQRASATALMVYDMLLEQGVCPEQARMVLPQNTMTEWIWSGTLFAFAKMCKLRLDPHTQKETQEIAKMIDAEAKTLYPVSWAALMEYGDA
jgi:thymidylate synthase (FAD)